jgi:hypothetical protein
MLSSRRMSLTGPTRLTAWLAAATLAAGLAFAERPAVLPAYTVEMVETQQAEGTAPAPEEPPPTGRLIFARRSDCAMVSHYFHAASRTPGGDAAPEFDEGTVVDPSCSCTRAKANSLRATTTYKLADEELRRRLSNPATPESNCLQTPAGAPAWSADVKPSGAEKVLGFNTVVFVDARNRAGYWRAPALGCQIVQSDHAFTGPAGAQAGVTRHRASRITAGAPDASLFAPVGDELKPSDVYRRRLVALGMDVEAQMQRYADRLAEKDRRYGEANR